MQILLRTALGLGLCLATGVVAHADDRNVPPKQAFVVELQRAMRSDDKAWIADHLHLPVRYFGATRTTITSKAWFISHYPKLIGPKLRAIVLAQDPEKIFENAQGMMIGDAPSIWFRDEGEGPDDHRFGIITINNDPR
jgi:hypothetical protein